MGQWVATKAYARWQPPKLGLEDIMKANRKRGRSKPEEKKAAGTPAETTPSAAGASGSSSGAPRAIRGSTPPRGKPQIGARSTPSATYHQAPDPASETRALNGSKTVSLPAQNMRPRTYDMEGEADQKALPVGSRPKGITQRAEPFGQMSMFDVPQSRETENFTRASEDKTDRISTTPPGMQPGRQVAGWSNRPTVNKAPGSQGVLIQPRKYR